MFSRLLSEIKGSMRLRVGLAVIVGVLWLYGALSLRDAAQSKSDEYQALIRQIAKVKMQTTQTDWPARSEAAKITRVELEGRLWHNQTLGLGQAAFQDWLNQLLVQTAVSRPVIAVTAADAKEGGTPFEAKNTPASQGAIPSDLWKVKAKLEFDFNPQSFNSLMTRLIASEQRVIVETLNVRKEPTPRVEAVLVAYFQKSKK